MKKARFVSFAVFVLFFGISLIEAVQKQNWMLVVLFSILGAWSLLVDAKLK